MSVLEDVFGGSAPVTIDDAWQPVGANGEPSTAGLVSQEIFLANQAAHAGRPFYTWAYDNIITGDCTSMFRQVYMAANRGCNAGAGRTTEQGRAIVMDHQFDPDGGVGFQTGQGLRVSVGGTAHDTPLNFGDPPDFETYPSSARVVTYASSFGFSTKPAELIVGALTTNNPQPRAGSIWQNPAQKIVSTSGSAIGSDYVHAKGDIVGVVSAGDMGLSTLVTSIRDTWYNQRPQCGWSAPQPGTNYIDFTTSKTNARFIFDQTYGTGGTAFSATSPGMTLPLANATNGLSTQVRVYVFVYAAMSGATNVGTIAIANKNASGTMASTPSAPTNPPVISGTTFKWYPTLSTWSATTGSYFMGYAGGAFDRVALCGISAGATDSLRIAAYTFVVAPSTT
jgi:hypothetical protein